MSLLAVALAAGALSACGGSDDADPSAIEQAREEGAEQARQSERIRQLQKEVKDLDRGRGGGAVDTGSGVAAGAAPSGSHLGSCGGEVSAGANTSCAFALNVADAYRSTGSSVLEVYSPTTGRTYTMSCTDGTPHVCTGGNDASVYFP